MVCILQDPFSDIETGEGEKKRGDERTRGRGGEEEKMRRGEETRGRRGEEVKQRERPARVRRRRSWQSLKEGEKG